MSTATQSPQRAMRLAFMWNDTVQDETLLEEPQQVVLGETAEALYPLAEGTTPDPALVLMSPQAQGYSLHLAAGMGGSVWVRGQRHEVQRLIGTHPTLPVEPDTFGVITLGPLAVFFQQVAPAPVPRRQLFAFGPSLLACVALSAFILLSGLFISFLDYRERPPTDRFELPADLVAKYMVVPPPEDVIEEIRSSGTETEDPGLRDREEGGGERQRDEEGRVGQQDAAQEQTELAGKPDGAVVAKVRQSGLLGALTGGGQGNAIAAALDVPSVSDVLSGMGAPVSIVGRGSRGTGLRGVGRGGGGSGDDGSLFGAGKIGTGLGAGSGGGRGKGKGGIGARGRKHAERKISVRRGNPRVNGYLSAEQINRVVRAHQAAVRYCYEVEVQRQPKLRGRVTINWRINLQGSVSSARVAKSSLRNPRVEGCITRQVRRWRFPKPDGGEVVVNYPFIFGIQGG